MEVFSPKDIKLSGIQLIEASAGTGKTYSIAILFLRMILEEISVDSILAVTFTNAATAELKSRIMDFLKISSSYLMNNNCENSQIKEIIDAYKEKLGNKKILELIITANKNFDESSVFTIHGFCRRLISENSFETGTLFNMELSADTDGMLTEAVEAFWRQEIQKIPKEIIEEISVKEWFSVEKLKDLIKGKLSSKRARIIPPPTGTELSWEKQIGVFSDDSEKSDTCNDLIILLERLFVFVKTYLVKERERSGKMGFDDLLLLLDDALDNPQSSFFLTTAMKERYKAVLIDEFQDTDTLQHKIFKTLFCNGNHIVFFIGDPKQAIYSFRNADVFAYLKARNEIEESSQFTMNTNYRSSKMAVNAVSKMFDVSNPFMIDGIGFPKVTSKKDNENDLVFKGKPSAGITVKFIRSEYASDNELSGNRNWKNRKIKTDYARVKAVEDMCREIIAILNERSEHRIMKDGVESRVKPSDIGVLVNSNDNADLVRRHFSKYSIPFVMASNFSIYKSEEAIDMEIVIEAFVDPSPGKIKAALLTFFFRESIENIQTLSFDESKMEYWLNFFATFQASWEKHRFLTAFSSFLESIDIYKKIAAGSGGERRLTNVRHLMELIHNHESENLTSAESTLQWLKDKMCEASPLEEEQLRLESDDNAVSIATVHKSKGLEYPIVFCPDLWRKSEFGKGFYVSCHDSENDPVLSFNTSDSELQKQYEKEMLSENLRLVYVALTRAKYHTFIYWGNIYGMGSTPLAKLFHGTTKDADFKKLDDFVLFNDLMKISMESFGSISADDRIESPKGNLALKKELLNPKSHRELKKEIKSDWMVTSFSSLTFHKEGEKELFSFSEVIDQEEIAKTDEDKENEPVPDILSFPAGATAGTALHTIFEKIDFKSCDHKELIAEVLDAYNMRYNDEKVEMTGWVEECVNAVLDAPVFNNKSLRDVEKEDVVSEMEFYFPVKNFSGNKLSSLFEGMISISDIPVSGFVHGFIDLIFKLDGKYYLVDWKSNRIGSSIDKYNKKSMTMEMKKHNYVLQYALYLAALDKLLEKRDPDYSYEHNFGGVFYFFLRGVSRKNEYMTGVYFDLPDKTKIDQLKKMMDTK